MARIIAVTNQKGGVGKTTTSINLSACLAAKKKKVLLVDIDPQGNATSGLGVGGKKKHTVYDVLIGNGRAGEAIVATGHGRLDLIPTAIELAGAEIELVDMEKREQLLKNALDEVRADYDYILIDCPPSLSLLTINALTAADSVLIPIQCEYYALEGVTSLMNTVNRIKHTVNPHLEIEGILLTMLDGRTNLGLQVVAEVKKHFKKQVFATTIPRNVRLGEAPSHGVPIHLYDSRSAGAEAYRALGIEVLARNGKKIKRK